MAPDSTEGWRGPSRGDFLMLPPMKLNAHIPQRLLHPTADYAVTRRAVKVSERTMAHGVDSDFQGMLRISHASNEQPRAPKSAQQSPDLSSRTRPAPASEDEIATPAGTPMQTFSTPQASAPRKARATQATKPPSPLGSTQRSVNRTIGQPQDRKLVASAANSTSAAAAEGDSTGLSDTTVSAIMNDVTNSSASPIADQRVRRRDGQSSVISKAPTKSEATKAATEAPQSDRKALAPAAATDAARDTPAIVNQPQAPTSRNGIPVPPELAPAPVAKDEPVAPAEIPLVTRKRSRDSLADPVAVAAAKKIAEAAAVAEVEAKAAADRARDMTPVQARPLGSSSAGTSEGDTSSDARTIVGSIVESTNPSRGGTPTIPSGRADITAPRRTAPSVAPIAPALESAIVEPSQSEPEEIALSARSAPAAESNASSSASESRSTSAPESTAGVQRRASGTPPVVAPASPTPAAPQQTAQGSSPAAGITAQPNGSTVSSGITAEPNGSSASSGVTAMPHGSSASSGITAEPNGSTAAAGMSADAQTSTPAAGNPSYANGSTVAAGTPAAAQGSHPSSGIEASANGSTVSPAIPSSLETVRPSATNDAPEVALTARSTPHVDTVSAGSSPAAGIPTPANGSSTAVAPAMSTNTSTSAAPTTATAQGSTASAGTVAEAQGSTAAAGVAAEAQGSTVSTPAQRPTEAVRARDIADAPEVALTARSTSHVDTPVAGSTPAASTPAPAQGSSPSAAPAMTANSSTPAPPSRAQAQGSTSAAGSPASSSSPSSTSAPSSLVTAGVQRRASADSGSAPAPTSSASDSNSSAESSSTEGASSVAHRESVRANDSTESPDIELVSRSVREASEPKPAASPSAPMHQDPVPAARASSHSVPADVRAAVAAVAGSAPQSMSLKRGAHVDAHASAIKADAFTAQGTVHVPGTAPLTSDSSRRLLAHELTHVMQQQRHGSRLPAENTPAGRALEAEALRAEGLIGMPSARIGSVAGMPPFSSGSSSPASSTPSARTSSPGVGTTAVAQGSTPAAGLVARANGSSAGSGNPASAHGSTAAAGTPAIARGSSPSAPAPVELAPRRPAPTPSPDASSGQHSQPGTYSGGGAPPPGMPPVQRRASGTPPQGSTYDSNMPDIKEAGKVAKAVPPSQQNAAAQQPPPDNTWRDQRWLEQHATALYPLIRNLLRDELLRDRERRGKMMREY